MTYACIGAHALQQQAAWRGNEYSSTRMVTYGWSLCAQWLEGGVTTARPTCVACLAACLVYEATRPVQAGQMVLFNPTEVT